MVCTCPKSPFCPATHARTFITRLLRMRLNFRLSVFNVCTQLSTGSRIPGPLNGKKTSSSLGGFAAIQLGLGLSPLPLEGTSTLHTDLFHSFGDLPVRVTESFCRRLFPYKQFVHVVCVLKLHKLCACDLTLGLH
jgi:hypothetical protein